MIKKLIITPLRLIGIDKNFLSSISMFLKFLRVRKAIKPDLIVGSYPGPTNIVLAHISARISGAKTLIDFRDAWTQDYQYKTSVFSFTSRSIEKRIVRRADLLTCVSNGVIERLSGYRYRTNPTILLRNGADRIDIATIEARTEERVFGYFGAILGASRDGSVLFHALKQANSISSQRVILEVYTNDDLRALSALVDTAGCADFVRILPAVEYRKFKEVACKWVAGIVLTRTDVKAKGELTTKLFDYLGIGLPVIGIAPEGFEIHEVIQSIPLCRSFFLDQHSELADCLASIELSRLSESDVRPYTRQEQLKVALGAWV